MKTMKNFINQTLKLSSRNCHTQTSILPLLHPWFITGFADGESCFLLNINESSETNTGYRVKAIFQINLHSKDRALLEDIQNYFGGIGYIYKYSGRDVVIYSVTSFTDLEYIITHFDKYPLISQK